MVTLTSEQLQALRAKAEAATPGEWRQGAHDRDRIFVKAGPNTLGIERVMLRMNARDEDNANWPSDAAFIASASPDVIIALLDQLASIEKHVAHNDDEYRTMKEVLRAEHQECERLRAELAAVNKRASDALDYMKFHTGDTQHLRNAEEILVGNMDAEGNWVVTKAGTP